MAQRPIRRTATVLAVIVTGALTLTGCGETLEERAHNRDVCEANGGIYTESISGWTYEYNGWNCDLSTDTEED